MNEEIDPTRSGEDVHMAQSTELATGVVGLFDAPHDANLAFEVLIELGYHPGEVGVMIAEATKQRFYSPSPLTHPAEAGEPQRGLVPEMSAGESEKGPEAKVMLAGAAAMSAVGALSGLLVAAGAAVVAPGFGLLLLGPLAGMGAGFGALVGGVYAVPMVEAEHHALVSLYEDELKAGKVLIHVVPHNAADEERIRSEWTRIRDGEV